MYFNIMEFDMKNYEVYSFKLEKYPDKTFYMVFKRDSFWKKINVHYIDNMYMEVIRWFCSYCCEY